MEILDTLITIALLVWCLMTLLSIRRNAQLDSPSHSKPVAAEPPRIDTLSDPLGRV